MDGISVAIHECPPLVSTHNNIKTLESHITVDTALQRETVNYVQTIKLRILRRADGPWLYEP